MFWKKSKAVPIEQEQQEWILPTESTRIEEGKCPDCQGEVESVPDCPRYGSPGKWKRCFPACGNAWQYYCNDCDWFYIDGLNPRYDAFKISNESRRPSWLSKK